MAKETIVRMVSDGSIVQVKETSSPESGFQYSISIVKEDEVIDHKTCILDKGEDLNYSEISILRLILNGIDHLSP